ncbi:MAG: aldehyde dehydrogenase family protein [Oscillospiraceae bacterium]|jgi:succinate-semialdehyde dehydrogenase|nr:aldehyde dehydrogenase family protein [Oscillospiraceae bacterium]
MESNLLVNTLIGNARKALAGVADYTQAQADEMVRAICLAFKAHGEELARETVEETRLGRVEDKIGKNMGVADGLMWSLKGKKSVGVIGEDKEKGLVYVAHPKGIVVVVAPTTNPNITALCNSVFALKGRNSVIICAHPRAKKTTIHTVEIMNEALKKLGAPENLIQVVREPSIPLTQELMKAADVIVATGGMAMVKSAYSSGVPAFGVGAGNVQTIIDRDCDLKEAAEQIVVGRSTDNGLICAGNQSVIMPAEHESAMVGHLREAGAYYSDNPYVVRKFTELLFPVREDGSRPINPQVVGQSAEFIAGLAGIEVPGGTKVIALRGEKAGPEEILCAEKMCPVLVTLTYRTFEEAVRMARENLLFQGAGHSAVIHSGNREHIEYAAQRLPVSRFLVNQPGIGAANPFLNNGLNPTTSLGCGSWGNNSISENLTYEHLINISRISYSLDKSAVPGERDIWG